MKKISKGVLINPARDIPKFLDKFTLLPIYTVGKILELLLWSKNNLDEDTGVFLPFDSVLGNLFLTAILEHKFEETSINFKKTVIWNDYMEDNIEQFKRR